MSHVDHPRDAGRIRLGLVVVTGVAVLVLAVVLWWSQHSETPAPPRTPATRAATQATQPTPVTNARHTEAAQPADATAGTVTSAKVKAEYLLRFPQFVSWPEAADIDAGVVIGLLAPDAMADYMAQRIEQHNRQVEQGEHDGPPYLLRSLLNPADVAGCHIVYIAGGDVAHKQPWLAAARGKPILSVCDYCGGVFSFVPKKRATRLQLDEVLAEQAGLVIREKLKAIALPGQTAAIQNREASR